MRHNLRSLLRRLNQQAWQALSRVGMSSLVRLLPDGVRIMDVANRRLFTVLDAIDQKAARFNRRFYKALMIQMGLVTVLWYAGLYAYPKYKNQLLESRDNLDPWVYQMMASPLKIVTISQVLQNQFIKDMLISILCSQVLESPRMSFVLGRNLGRTVADPYIQQNLNILVKKTGLKDNVLYSPEIYYNIKTQLIRQLQGENLRGLIRYQSLNFLKSESGTILMTQNFGDTLRLKPVVDSFVEGVVNKKVYGMIENKENARKLDNTLYEILK